MPARQAQGFDQTIGAKGQKHGAPRAPCRKESKGALHHHPDQRDHLQPHNLARYFAGSPRASRGVDQCPASGFFSVAHGAYITAPGGYFLRLDPTWESFLRYWIVFRWPALGGRIMPNLENVPTVQHSDLLLSQAPA